MSESAPNPTPNPGALPADGPGGAVLAYQRPLAPALPPGWTNVAFHGYLPGRMKAFAMRQSIRLVAFFAFVLCAGIAFEWSFLRAVPEIAMEAIGVIAVLATLAGAFRVWRSRRAIMRQWPTFRIVVADQGVGRICLGYQDLFIPFERVRDMREAGARGIWIRGSRSMELIWIASGDVENYAEIRERLAAARPLRTVKRWWLLAARNYTVLAVRLVLFFGIFAWGMYSTDLPVELACVALLVVWVTASIVMIWRNPNVTHANKVRSLVSFLIPIYLCVKIYWMWD